MQDGGNGSVDFGSAGETRYNSESAAGLMRENKKHEFGKGFDSTWNLNK